MAVKKKRAEPKQLPQPPWLDTTKLIERFAYPSYANLDAVIELIPEKGSARERELWERCASHGRISPSWLSGEGPLFCVACGECGATGVSNAGIVHAHEPGCRFERSPSTLEIAAAFAAESRLVIDAEPVAREWRRALEPWGAARFESVCWSYEKYPPQLLGGWREAADLHYVMMRPAVAAAIAVNGAPTIMFREALAAGLGSPRDTAWIDAVFTAILAQVRGRKKPGKPRRFVDDEDADMLAFALEGAALWHAALEANAKVTSHEPKANERGRSPWANMLPPKPLLAKRFADLPNPWPPLVALLATGTRPVGALHGTLALNLLPFEHRTIDA